MMQLQNCGLFMEIIFGQNDTALDQVKWLAFVKWSAGFCVQVIYYQIKWFIYTKTGQHIEVYQDAHSDVK